MTNQEREFKKAFKHRHVTNVMILDKKYLRVFFRYKTNREYKAMRNRIQGIAEKLETLKSPVIQFADETKNYQYDVITFRIIK